MPAVLGATLVSCCLSVVSPNLYAAGENGADGTAGSAGTSQTLTIVDQSGITSLTPPTAGTAGGVAGDGTRGQAGFPANMSTDNPNSPPTAGGKGGDGGIGGTSGASGNLTATVGATGMSFDFSGISAFGVTGVAGTQGGNGGIGGAGGGYNGDSVNGGAYSTATKSENGGMGGNGGAGAAGANGGNVNFTFNQGTFTFANNTIFGGLGGNGGAGGLGGQGGNGGIGIPAQGVLDLSVIGGGTYPAHDGRDGGDGGNGGVGGVGGAGGNGGNAVLSLTSGTLNFGSGVVFGGNGGNGGVGGKGGAQGIAGTGGANSSSDSGSLYTGTAGNAGLVGAFGNGDAGGVGGNAGNGTLTITGGTVNFLGNAYFGGTAGAGGNGGAAGGTGASAGTKGADGNAASGSKLQLNGGTLNLGGNIVFRGTNNTVAINGGTLSFDGNRTIDAGSGTVTVAGGSTLSRTSATGVLTINAASISGPSSGQIILDIQGNGGEFLSANVAPSNLTAASFNVDNYRQGTEVKSTASGFELILGGGALPFEWKGTDGSGNGKWKLGSGSDRNNWDNQEYDFATGDIANFKGQGQGDVTLVGLVNPGKINITAGTYNFKGEDANAYFSTPELNVSGTGTKLTISNTKANNVDVTNIGVGSEIDISRGGALGSGTVNNNGKLNVTLAADGELANVLAGTGTVEKTGAGKLTLTGNSTAAGGTINVTDGSLEVGNGTSGSYNGNIVSASDVTFNNDNDTVYAGSFSNGGRLVKKGTGALTLSGSAASGVEINAGSIIVGNTNALGTGTDIKTGGTLNVNGISVTSAIDLNGGSLVNNNSATAATVNNVALSADSKIGGNGDLTISAQLTGNFNLEKTGTGTTTLTEDNNAIGATTVSGGKLQLAGTVGNAGNAVVLGNGTALVVNRNGDVAGDISGAGSVDILKNASLTGTALSYTGATNVTGATLTGNISSQSDLLLTNTATYNLGGADRTVKSANIESGSKIDLNGQDLTVTGTLDVIATQSRSDAPIQGNNGKLVLASGSTFNANLENDKTAYSLSAGGTTPVYFADGLSGYTDSGATVNTTGNRLFRVEGGLNYSNNSLFVNIKRNFAADLFPNISPQLAPVIDNYAGNNDWIEYMMTNEDDDSVTEKYVQGGLDLVNLSNAMSVLYDTQTGIDNILYSRSRHFVTRSTRSNYLTLGQCDPCDAVSCDSLYCGSGSDREFYVAPIYGNHRGYNLSSGGFNYGYVNDQWAMGFGVDQSYGRTRVGLLGVYGEGKALTRGTLPKTINETSFGGLFLYANTHRGDLDLLLTAGYLGMENSVEQFTSGDSLSGNITNGLAAFSAILTQTLRYGDLYVLPSFGIEYGYYHQGSLSAKYGDDKVVVTRGDKSHANLAVIPVGVRLTREGVAFGGRLNPEFRARYIANVGGVSADYNTWLIGSPSSALMSTRMTDRHAGDIGLGFGWTRQAVSLRGDVGYLFAEHYGDLTVSGSATWKF